MDSKLSRRDKRKEERSAKSNGKHQSSLQRKQNKPKRNSGGSGLKIGSSSKTKMAKKKTKFEEYLEMDTQKGVASLQEDLKFEKELEKKLKVQNGLLPGTNDHINSLFVDTDSECEFLEDTNPGCESQELSDSDGELLEAECLDDKSVEEESTDDKSVEEESTDDESAEEEDPKDEDINSENGSLEDEESEDNGENSGSPLADKVLKRNLKCQGAGSEPKKKQRLSNHGKKLDAITETGKALGQDLESRVTDEAADSPRPIDAPEEGAYDDTTSVSASKGNAKYEAPHLRNRVKDSAEHLQIRRRVRGLLNRLSESNVESITGELCDIYRSVGRNVGSQIVSEEILASCSGGPRGNEQYAATFAACVTGIACLVGIDFSAKLLASLAKSFEDEYLKEDNLSFRNLTLLLAYLYIFGVCSSDLMYDFLIMLSKRLTEVDVSTVLTILQCCGMKLRSDDPAAMKTFIQSVQKSANELKSSADGQKNLTSKRMEFMLETICEIKNNKRRAKEDSAQHTRIKKWLQKLRAEDILIQGVTWSKLLDPKKRGQWWCSGDPASVKDNFAEVATSIDMEVLEAQKMLQLAAAQRMNTDTRRAIFCIIMSGEDYVDAFEKLLRLDLSGKQDREIMRVLLECCLQEKVFNKYYTVVASKLCGHDKKHKFTLQHCLWDQFKELESMQLQRLMHLSRFVAELLASFTLSLSASKAVELSDITQLTPKRIMHFRILFEALFEYSDKLVWNIFTRIAIAPDLEELKSGIEFFVNRYVVGDNKAVSRKFRVAKKALKNIEGILM